jgi:hypothetical protein
MALTGSELLAKVKEQGDASKSDLVRAAGYVSTKKDGSERLNFTAFYEALLEARPTPPTSISGPAMSSRSSSVASRSAWCQPAEPTRRSERGGPGGPRLAALRTPTLFPQGQARHLRLQRG